MRKIGRRLARAAAIAMPVVAISALSVPADAATCVDLRNAASDKCLAVGGSSQVNGAPAIQWEYGGNADQFWYRS